MFSGKFNQETLLLRGFCISLPRLLSYQCDFGHNQSIRHYLIAN
uniref:Uncharacterized protein n=1 Tax=Arundo donax TaxID=35708 RepID=A0A0A9Q2R8_ARUDO